MKTTYLAIFLFISFCINIFLFSREENEDVNESYKKEYDSLSIEYRNYIHHNQYVLDSLELEINRILLLHKYDSVLLIQSKNAVSKRLKRIDSIKHETDENIDSILRIVFGDSVLQRTK